ncbi:hypothetical protein SY86_10860 [Erwinia tracheiphila]|uniref:Uncharacterized protein n=1 Tax=Erwinia tracheiphila TaxID=65700 RepID=A0A0M2KEY8_9GAMM|nr:hypothetical protein [Erwinia tracheiphila]EOS93245.1 hypothetical protein ETR_20083 [Erwinia tracheiphila PSU-1]KKF35813.1 hypothetical protein SY86_10860 [Erwinia tracheiphila]
MSDVIAPGLIILGQHIKSTRGATKGARWIPISGIAFMFSDIATAAWKATVTYNHIVRKEDRLWN